MPVNDYEPEPLPTDAATPSMIERVARAIAVAYTTVPFDEMSDWDKDTNYRRTRAAIAAMREPTKIMDQAAHDGSAPGEPYSFTEMWEQAIDAALAEGNGA